MSMLELGPIIFGENDYLRQKRLLAKTCDCTRYFIYMYIIVPNMLSRCHIPMEERPRRDISDGFSWWCRRCKTRTSIRHGSFFSLSKLTLKKWLLMIHYWAIEAPVTDAVTQSNIDIRTAVDIYQWLREICSTKLLQSPSIILGARSNSAD